MGNEKLQESPDTGAPRLIGSRTRGFTAVALTSLFLAGCSSVPDALNPVEWYKGTRDLIVGKDEPAPPPQEGEKPASGLVADRGKPPPGSDKPIPSIGSVPDRPQTSTPEERQRIAEGLASERDEGRRYSTEVIARQTPAESQLAPPPPAQIAAQPAPPAASAPVAIRPGQGPSAPPPAPSQQAAAAPPPPPQLTRPAPMPAPAAPTANLSGPRPPALAPVPPPAFGPEQGIVVVSGDGVQTVAALQPASFAGAPSGSGLTGMPPAAPTAPALGTRTLSDFNPTMARGSYQVADILFANGSSSLGGREREILREVVKQHRQVGGTIRVVGHASQRTKTLEPNKHKMVNFQVSVARAESVARELIRLGVQPGNLFVGAVSDRDPKYREYMPSGEAGNRRAEIYIDY